ncbi:MAG: hypothetical protein JXM70_26100 [Pirellulales bacterium]|nr:hypothetical protein [Pirellulales bacterium]
METFNLFFLIPRRLLVGMVLCLFVCTSALAERKAIDIREFGAQPGEKTPCTKAIQKAIDKCSRQGGGTVYLPPGNWLSGTIFLKSHVTLWLENGSTLTGSKDLKDYQLHRPKIRSHTDKYVNRSLIAGEDLENIAIRGRGRIYGSGEAFPKRDYLTRPFVIRLINCRDVLVEGITLENSPMWMQLYLACERLMVRGIRVDNHTSFNNDGLNIDSCRDVCVSDCIIDSDDDAIAIKSSCERPCENVVITNCVLSSKNNGIKMGTESHGGFKNINITNCTIHASPVRKSSAIPGIPGGRVERGIILLVYDGGTMDGINISNITMDGVYTPIGLGLRTAHRPYEKNMPKKPIGTFRNIIISNIVGTRLGKRGCHISGLPEHPIENILLSNVKLTFDGGGTQDDADKKIRDSTGRLPGAPESGSQYSPLPGYGFYIRHVKGLTLRDVQLCTEELDLRPALACDYVENLRIDNLDAKVWPDVVAMIRMLQVQDALICGCRPPSAIESFLRLQGKATRDIVLAANDFGKVRKIADQTTEVSTDALTQIGNKIPKKK